MNTKKLDRMGLNGSYINSIMSNIEIGLEIFRRYDDLVKDASQPSVPGDFGRRNDLDVYCDIISLRHFGVDYPGFGFPCLLHQTAELAKDYFLGDWRDNANVYDEPCDRAGCRQELPWVDPLRIGLFSSLLCNDLQSLDAICSYVAKDLPDDDGAWDRTNEDRTVLMFLAEDIKRLRDVNTNVVTPAREKFRQQRSKAWIDGLRSLINRDKSGLMDSVSRLVSDFKKRDLQLPQSRVVVSWDASILLALARLRNSWEFDCNHEVFDYIFTQESLAIT